MGAKGPKAIVSPTEWVRRTSLTFKKRSADTLKLDEAYAAWSANPSRTAAAINLHKVLRDYLKSKGGVWSKVERDKVSGGLIEWVYQEVQKVPGVVPPAPSPAQAALQNTDIPHSRYGVLYLLGNIDIDMSALAIALEGVSALGNIAGQAVSTNFDHLGNDKLAARTVDVMGQTLKTGTISTAGAAAVKLAGTKLEGRVDPATKPRQHVLAPPPPKRPEPGFPLTLAMYELVKEDPILMLNPFMLGATVVGTVGAAVIDALNSLRIVLQNAVTDLAHYILREVANPSAKSLATLGATIKGMVKFVVGKCLASAAPFVGGALDLAGGLVQTFKAAKDRIGAWMQRRKIVLNPGHPELAANAIEANMTKGIFAGLWSVLKGVASLALSALLPGAGNLVSALVTGVEWLIKFVWRIWEQSKISKFLKLARQHFGNEKSLAEANTLMMKKKDPYYELNYTSKMQLHPQMDPRYGGIIHNLPKFKEFYKLGCDASPLIPMLTFNTGICGSLMVLMRMFDDTEAMISQKTWDAGDAYFTKLKQYGRGYLQAAGFEFKALDASNRPIQGILNHAVQHHHGHSGKLDKALAFGAGFAG